LRQCVAPLKKQLAHYRATKSAAKKRHNERRIMARDVTDTQPIETRGELVEWFEAGSKPDGPFRVGTEHEKIPFYAETRTPVPYAGARGIRALLEGMRARLGWEPILDDGHLIGLFDEKGGGAISLEPGGQFELSGAPLDTIHETAAETQAHFNHVHAVAEPLGISFLDLGMSPLWSLDETPVMPKRRYAIMMRYMPKVGTRGLDMMFRTATIQANLDYAGEADMVGKLRLALALQPLATALFANSPFTDGKPNGRLSERSEIWRDTDNNRAGMLPFAFEPGMGFERYVDYALDVPMYFVKRGDTYHDVTGASFRDLMAGKLAALPGERATVSDWANHLSTIFPEVRLKRYLEMRGCDGGAIPHINAVPAFFVGLLYDARARDAAWQIVKGWSAAEREQLRADVPRLGLAARIGGRALIDIARDVVPLAKEGLARRGNLNARGEDESIYLAPLNAIVATGRNNARNLLELYEGPWGGSILPAFGECVY
jgi:glutamate--cysteine ligase